MRRLGLDIGISSIGFGLPGHPRAFVAVGIDQQRHSGTFVSTHMRARRTRSHQT